MIHDVRPERAPAPLAHTLAQVQQQVIELLARLERPPATLRISAGEVTVELAWPAADIAPAPGASAPAAVGPVREPADDPPGEYLTSPAVGVFYHAREPGAEPFVAVGSDVRPGQQIGVVEAMKLMIPVEADRAGRITEVIKGNGEPVEYAEPLFALDAEEG